MAVQAAQVLVDNDFDTLPDASSEKNPVVTQAIKIIRDTTLALWGSRPRLVSATKCSKRRQVSYTMVC